MRYSILGNLSLEQAAAKYKKGRLFCAGVVSAALGAGAVLYLIHTRQTRALCLSLCILLDSAALCFAYSFWSLRLSVEQKLLALAKKQSAAEMCIGTPRAVGTETIRVQGLDVYAVTMDEDGGLSRTVFCLHRELEPLCGKHTELQLVDNIVIRAGEVGHGE